MLNRLGLQLHEDKTRVVHAKRGFDFLGIHFRLCRKQQEDCKTKMVLLHMAIRPFYGKDKTAIEGCDRSPVLLVT